ncbi:hypothetical protein YC2023_065287 [Brassica napus]
MAMWGLHYLLVAFLIIITYGINAESAGITRHYTFHIQLKNITRLCKTKSIVAVNGKFPGPKVTAREGDNLQIKVVNHVSNNISIHWHGIRQLRSGWADGPSYVTQCPIQTGQSYVYNFTIIGQRGTLWWHAHIQWMRATVYGPLIILPKLHQPYPFPKPYKQVPIIFGEWFNADPQAVVQQALQTGAGPNASDAHTFNGLPGPLYNCSTKDTYKLVVKPGKTYLLRLINAALDDELFFTIANHTLTVVEADASYVKPFQTNIVLLGPGQTTNVLLKTKPIYPNATFYMLARPYFTGQGTIDNTTVAGILKYHHKPTSNHFNSSKNLPVIKPTLPPINSQGFGNFDPTRDPKQYNLVDPVERNTINVPSGGWVAIRFLADNPGVWFMHCHIEIHLSWGLTMAWVVLDGDLPNQKLPPPPSDFPKC